ncbi:interferon lambda receptor 1 [Embiotoca jacksoni]|uniref:interferon lambda receptor 1 n=1 Tax=Embiotoca jacksoni TaxID=100190 RepID=UPI0037043A9B
MWSMNVIILLLFCYACLSTGNGGVRFVSKNFDNVLHWDPVKPDFPGQKVLYSVQYWSDAKDQPFQIKKECQNITVPNCNLTAETPSLHYDHYRAQVFVNGRILGFSNIFRPLRDTDLGAPILSIKTTMSSLSVNVTLPLGPNGVPIEDIITRSKDSKTIPLYTLNITHPEWATQVKENRAGQFVINLKNDQTEYCGYVVYKLSSEWGRSGSEMAFFCATLQDDPWMLWRWLLVGVAVLAVLVIMSVVCMCNYVKGGRLNSMPQALVTTTGSCKVLQFPDRNLIISKAVVGTQSDQTVYAKIQVNPNVPSVGLGGYSPQDTPWNVWERSSGSSVGTDTLLSTTSGPEDTSAQSSENYGAVAIHVPVEENEDSLQCPTDPRETSQPPSSSSGENWDNGETSPRLASFAAPPSPDCDACESNAATQLLLQTVRDSNGQLMLPSLSFLLQSSTGGTVPPMNPERKPLLSDLMDSEASLLNFDSSEWSDCGCDDSSANTPTHPYCNTHYSPSQSVLPDFHLGCPSTPSSDAIFQSGYKQNWMAKILHGPEVIESREYIRKNYPHTQTGGKMVEEGEQDESRGVERSRQILLGSWMVQIQE